MGIYEENIKRTYKTTNKVKCKCGSVRIEAKVFAGDYDEFDWLQLNCKACGNTLFYNGA